MKSDGHVDFDCMAAMTGFKMATKFHLLHSISGICCWQSKWLLHFICNWAWRFRNCTFPHDLEDRMCDYFHLFAIYHHVSGLAIFRLMAAMKSKFRMSIYLNYIIMHLNTRFRPYRCFYHARAYLTIFDHTTNFSHWTTLNCDVMNLNFASLEKWRHVSSVSVFRIRQRITCNVE